MPWSAKAQALLKDQYAAVGAAAGGALPEVIKALLSVLDKGVKDAQSYLEKLTKKNDALSKYVKAYQNYCWPVTSIDDYKLAPFHILATEGQVHVDKINEWHMENIAEICKGDFKLLMATAYKIINLNDQFNNAEAINWWMELANNGGEGMVVNPLNFIATSSKGLLQPAVKCRGKEYLRIIYGP